MKEEDFEFPMILATTANIKSRKLVHGVGINDSWYKTHTVINGKRITCPYYQRWQDMLRRGYSRKLKEKYSTYKDVTVCEDWYLFSKFHQWMEKQDWKDKHLDKDIVCPNNKVYSPETCVFVTGDINMLLINRGAARGKYCQGVNYHKGAGKFQATCNQGKGKQKYLGLFPTEALAYEAYVNYKHNLILEVADEQEDIRVKNGLLLHAQILLDTLEDA
mgnify:FL=1